MTARPIEALELSNVSRAPVGPHPRMMRIDPAELWVDGLYQRDLSKSLKLIEKLVREWDWSRFSIPVVTSVDGAWHVIDGQHTAIAALSHAQGIGSRGMEKDAHEHHRGCRDANESALRPTGWNVGPWSRWSRQNQPRGLSFKPRGRFAPIFWSSL